MSTSTERDIGSKGSGAVHREGLDGYVEHRNQPQTDDVSHMSKYLHYGHVSPVYVALKIRGSGGPAEDIDSYLEEVIVRRELSMNFCHYTPDYDSYSCLPEWAKKTLEEHADDEREYEYSPTAENAETHASIERGDESWPIRLRAHHMRCTGKEILSGVSPREAYRRRSTSTQVFLGRPGRELLRQRRLGIRPARPGLEGAGSLWQGPLHVGGRSGKEGPTCKVRREGGAPYRGESGRRTLTGRLLMAAKGIPSEPEERGDNFDKGTSGARDSVLPTPFAIDLPNPT